MASTVKRRLTLLSIVGSVGAMASCAEDPAATASGSTTVSVTGAACTPAATPAYAEDVSNCSGLSTDYQPRENQSANDTWASCITDDDGNTYYRINQSTSTIERVASFDQIESMLWAEGVVPTPQAFVDARVIYAQEQGLDSRVQRRYDINYPEPAGGPSCSDEGVADANPDYCVGPAKLLPVLNDAFQKGAAGEAPLRHAARVEAALIWFLYVSSIKEAMTCTDTAKDCDSSWAYFTGGVNRSEATKGLARHIQAQAPETFQRGFDAVLAVRCWRNLEGDTVETASTQLSLRDQAIAQLNTALLRGVGVLIRQRLLGLDCATGDYRDAHLAYVQTLLPLFDRAARERDTAAADVLKAAAEADADSVDVTAAVAAIDAQFACP